MRTFWLQKQSTTLTVAVTPAMATEMLKGSADVQRPLRKRWVAELCRRMLAGLWSPPADQEPLMFSTEGKCIEGQHRLHALVMSGLTLLLQVKVGCSPEAIRTIGEGKTRNPVDKISVRLGEHVTALGVAVATRMLHPGGATESTTVEEREAFYLKHLDAIAFVEALNTGKAGRKLPSSVLAVIGRAFYSRPKNKLREFVDILITGDYDRATPGHLGAHRFRDWLTDHPATGTENRIEMYWQTVAALDAFLTGTNRSAMKAASQERFLLDNNETPFVRTSKRTMVRKDEAE